MKNKGLLKIIILSVFFVQTGNMIVTPALDSIAKSFPNIPFTSVVLVSTLPILISVPTALIIGRLAGRVIRYKALLIVAMIIYIVFGIAPFFVADFTLLLVFRAAVGISTGILLSLGMPLVILYFEPGEHARIMGHGNTAGSAGGILYQVLSGVVALKSWQYSFLLYGLGIITLGLVLFLPKQQLIAPQIEQKSLKMKASVYLYMPLVFAVSALCYPIVTNMSFAINYYGMGSTVDTGFVLMMFTVGGIVTGMIFAKLFDILKMRSFIVAFILLSVASLFMAYGKTLGFMYTATTFAGLGFSILFLTVFMVLGQSVHPDKMAMATAMAMAAMSIGNFVSSYIFVFSAGLLGDRMHAPFYLSASIFAIAGILSALFIRLKPTGKVNPDHYENIDLEA